MSCQEKRGRVSLPFMKNGCGAEEDIGAENMDASTFSFSVIIPVYNKWELTVQCMRSLKACTQEYAYEVIVVDNASSDDTLTCLDVLGRELFGAAFHAIHLSENRNFGPACNLGAQKAQAPLLFFLNNDTVLTPRWAPPLVESFAKNHDLAAVGPLLLYENNTVQHVGVVFGVTRPLHIYRYFPSTHPAVLKERDVQSLTGAALLVQRKLFLSVGGFYEAYCNGFEDVDLCLHMHNIGMKLRCIPKSIIYHLESQTPGRDKNNENNGIILKHRCGKMFYPDVHVHGMRDGFMPFIAEDLDISLRMTQEEENALFAQAEGQSIEYWHDLIVSNPLWIGGRKHIAELAEQQGNMRLALLLYSEIASWIKSSHYYAKIVALEGHVDNVEQSLFDEAKRSLYKLQCYADATCIKRKLRDIRKWNDKKLLHLYEEKYAALQQGKG